MPPPTPTHPPSGIQGQHRWLHRRSWLPVILTRSGWMCVRLGVWAVWKGLAELHSHTKSFSASSDCRRDARCALRSATQNCFISSVCLSSSIFPFNAAALLCSAAENQTYRWESSIENPYYNTGQFKKQQLAGHNKFNCTDLYLPPLGPGGEQNGTPLAWHSGLRIWQNKERNTKPSQWIYIFLNFIFCSSFVERRTTF